MSFCQKCGAKIGKDAEFCNKCGAKSSKTENIGKKHREPKSHKGLWIFLTVIVGLLIISAVVIFVIPLPYTATEAYTEQQPYEAQESYDVQKTSTTTINRENCDDDVNCKCIKKNWLFQCVSCSCNMQVTSTDQRTVTKYKDVQRTRAVTKYATLYQQWSGQVKWWYSVDEEEAVE
ncbi:MAG: zinc-ribbon domain-containing protein [Candidatus Thorarchaeota archaeon]